MKPRIGPIGATPALGLILLGMGCQEAKADTFPLKSANQPFTGGLPYASVDVSSPGAGQVKFVVTVLTSPTDKIGEFGFNTNLSGITASNFTTLPNGWSVSKNANISGFGRFSLDVGNSAAAKRVHQATIVLSRLSSTALSHFEIANSKSSMFVVHLFQPGLTGYAAATPEPSTLAIAVLGALGLIGYGLHRRLKK
jgi:hypothetical protein